MSEQSESTRTEQSAGIPSYNSLTSSEQQGKESVENDHSPSQNSALDSISHLILHDTSTSSAVLQAEREMSALLPASSFVAGKVTHVYNPLIHAAVPHAHYTRLYATPPATPGQRRFLLMGMNPGPWGMSQTGVPFGEVALVRDWLRVRGEVMRPTPEHPQRPVLGLNCTRSEVSGRRFWGFFRDLCCTPDRLFRHAFVYNFCPLAFMERSGKNVTPNLLPRRDRQKIDAVCGRALVTIIQILNVTDVVGIGKYAEQQASRLVKQEEDVRHVRVHPLLHPSPISPQANKDWVGVATKQLTTAGLIPLLMTSSDDVTSS